MPLKVNMILGNHKSLIIFLFIFFLASFFLSTLKADPIEGNIVEIQILDKITAKVNTLSIRVNKSINFQSLKIEILACYKNPPEEIPEDFVLLKIYDEIIKKNIKNIFQGWMISSSPAVTPLEHPIYDLWVKSCNNDNDLS